MAKDSSTYIFITAFLNSAKEHKRGIYSDEPQVTPQQLAEEVKAAETEFSKVINEELEKIELLAAEENDRILELRRQNEAEMTCPFCLEVIPAISSDDEKFIHMSCCGVCCHSTCYANWNLRKVMDPTISKACFYCRRRHTSDTPGDRELMNFFEELILTGGMVSKAYALGEIGDAYEKGIRGKKRNLKKALEYYEQAAEMGNHEAQARIAVYYHNGEFHEWKIPKSQEKAMDLAQRAVDQGNRIAQYLLGSFLSSHDTTCSTKTATRSFRLYAISAYQGDIYGVLELEKCYSEQFEILNERKNKSIQEEAETRKYLLLSLYWAGRFWNNKKREDELPPHVLMNGMAKFALNFQKAIKLWHVRSCFHLESFTGYSHIPFSSSMLSMIVKVSHDESLEKPFQIYDYWKHICANCGKRGGTKECVLKTCARCKAFSYCSKKCQVTHWKAGHKVDCKGHWIESYFPNIRKP